MGIEMVTVLFHDMVCTALNMDQNNQREELPQEMRKKIIDEKYKDYLF